MARKPAVRRGTVRAHGSACPSTSPTMPICAAVGEASFGAGAASAAVAYLTISTGIGAGVVHRGRLVPPRDPFARRGRPLARGIDWRALKAGAGPEHRRGAGVGQRYRPAQALKAGMGAVDARPGRSRLRRGGGRAAGRSAIWRGGHRRVCGRACRIRWSHVLLPEHGRHRGAGWGGRRSSSSLCVREHGPEPTARADIILRTYADRDASSTLGDDAGLVRGGWLEGGPSHGPGLTPEAYPPEILHRVCNNRFHGLPSIRTP